MLKHRPADGGRNGELWGTRGSVVSAQVNTFAKQLWLGQSMTDSFVPHGEY